VPLFRRKPIVCKAEQFFSNNFPRPEGVLFGRPRGKHPDSKPIYFVRTSTEKAWDELKEGWWIFYLENGERRVASPKHVEEHWDLTEPEPTVPDDVIEAFQNMSRDEVNALLIHSLGGGL
jgi:hypothetical protein